MNSKIAKLKAIKNKIKMGKKKVKRVKKKLELECTHRARMKYEDKRERKTVSFNRETAEDVAMLKFVETLDFSPWVKNALRAELDKRKAHG